MRSGGGDSVSVTEAAVRALRRLSQLMNRASGQEGLQDLLDMIVNGAADIVGFQVAAISLVRADDQLEVVAVAGDEDARQELLGRRTPRSRVEAEFAVAEQWGSLRFVAADRLPQSAPAGWVTARWEQPTGEGPDRWDPQDTLLAPFHDPAGEMLGLLSVDLPLDGQRPGGLQQATLEVFANQAGIAINGARQRTALRVGVVLASAVLEVAGICQQVREPAQLVRAVADPIGRALRGEQVWIRAFATEGTPSVDAVAALTPGDRASTPPHLIDLARRISERCWRDQVPGRVREGQVHPRGLLTAEESSPLLDFVGRHGGNALLLAPLGAGSECLGHLVLTRGPDASDWSDEECAASLEVGRDLGRAIVNARLLELERVAASRLREANRSKTTLLSTVSHELKNPLASLVGHLELLKDDPDGDVGWSLGVVERNIQRLQGLVEDLLALSRVSDPDRPVDREPVDLTGLVQDSLEMQSTRASRQGVRLEVALDAAEPVVSGSRHELAQVVDNLISNAIKFTPSTGTVSVSLSRVDGSLRLVCSDQGIGISEADQQSLFTEFFRSTNPTALKGPGTGLGLSIAQRVVQRHGGTIAVESELGSGTVLTVTLPAA